MVWEAKVTYVFFFFPTWHQAWKGPFASFTALCLWGLSALITPVATAQLGSGSEGPAPPTCLPVRPHRQSRP